MASLHVRSKSLPSKSHPVVNDVEDNLHRLRSSEATSTSATSVSENLGNLRDLHEGIDNLLQMPSIQQVLAKEGNERWTNELLEESLGLVDLCGFVREVLSSTKDSVQQLRSSIRRSRGESTTTDDYNAYMASRKKINKMVSKFIKSFNGNCTTTLDDDSNHTAGAEMLKEAAAFDFSVLKSALLLLSGEKGGSKKRNRWLLSMFQKSHVKGMDGADVQNVLEQTKSSEVAIQALEEELEALYRALVKSRVSLLNALNH